MNKTENLIAEIEQRLNVVDYVPIASSFSGMFRIYLGTAEIVASVAYVALQILSLLLTGRFPFRRIVSQGLTYGFHGISNIARGAIAMIVGLNLLLIAYDMKIGRINYDLEELRSDVYPLMTAHKLAYL